MPTGSGYFLLLRVRRLPAGRALINCATSDSRKSTRRILPKRYAHGSESGLDDRKFRMVCGVTPSTVASSAVVRNFFAIMASCRLFIHRFIRNKKINWWQPKAIRGFSVVNRLVGRCLSSHCNHDGAKTHYEHEWDSIAHYVKPDQNLFLRVDVINIA